MIYSLFYADSGDFSGHVFSCPPECVAANVIPGMAVISGRYDPARSRVIFADDGFGNAVPVVVKRKPPKPPDTDLVAFDWDDAADDWRPEPTLAARRAALRSVRNAGLLATDGPAIAAMEALLAAAMETLGVSVPEDVQALLEHRQALRSLPQRGDFDQLSVVDVPRYAGAAGQGV
jgi:hypothetical protein